jgi:NADPH-dependent glutamate synthase beta subunit-like oxidoreductase/NAD(P)H-flavin reductase
MPSKKFLNHEFNIEFQDLYDIEGLEKIHKKFLEFLKEKSPAHFLEYQIHNSENSQYLIEIAKILEVFLVELFLIHEKNSELKAQYLQYTKVCEVRKEFIQRHISKKYSYKDLESIENFDYQKILQNLAINFSQIDKIEIALSNKILAKKDLEIIEKYCIWALFDKVGQNFHKTGTLFILPQKTTIENLTPQIKKHHRAGFDLTDNGCSALRASGEAHYCIFCHNQKKDSCKTGLIDKETQKIKIDELGIKLEGCPLEEKISEMNFLKSGGFSLASLAMAIIDNPMIAGTGHRICNDCMKSCIYQKQDPVDIPQIESRILKDILNLPFGFEIYSLLTKWNPLNIINPLPKKLSGKKILVCGLGPAGYTLSHYLLNEGHEIVAIDGLKIEPLNAKISGVDPFHNRFEFEPIENISEIYEPLSSRLIAGFGGVAEYGITARFDKNYLKIIRLLLERRKNFAMYGGIRFGSSITDKIAFEEYGFDHVALCVGAGRPQFLDIKNNFSKGCRLASDFLMALQLTGAYQKNLFTNLQIRAPIIVIGGGLTAVDSATEAQAYYKIQVEKFAEKLQKFADLKIDEEFFKGLNDEERVIAQEFINDAKKFKEDKNFSQNAKILYRKKMIDSNAYRLNRQELKNALEEGVEFLENSEISEIIVDKFNHVCAIKTKAGERIECKTLLMAVGTMPNISFVLEDNLEFANDGKYLSEIFLPKQALEVENLQGKKSFSIITKIDEKSKKSVSFFGDLHANFEGNVVKAMASAKKGYHQINDALKLIIYPTKNIEYKNYREDFLVSVLKVDRLSENVVEIYVKSKLLANQTQVGQIFRLHNYHALAQELKGQTLAMEGVVVTALAIDKEAGVINGIIVETGGSSSLIKNFKSGEPCVFMGPSGKPTEIPRNETVVLVGGGRGNQPLTTLAEIFKDNGCKVLFFAGYRQKNFIVRPEKMKKCCNELIISVEEEASQIGYFKGSVIDSIKNYFVKNKIKIDRVFAIGNDYLMHEVARLRHENMVPEFADAKYSITSLNSPMQCMMKGVCGQCLQKKQNINGEFEYFYSCANQDQSMDEIDFEHLHARCEQNSLLEKVTKLWVKNLK